eukprot:SAG31_NODE_25485_length_460_cov_0.997230_1_plen_39_part_10
MALSHGVVSYVSKLSNMQVFQVSLNVHNHDKMPWITLNM